MNTANESLSFALLGRVRAWRGSTELDLGSPQQRVVLAALLLRRGRPVTVPELVDAVWGEAPPTAAVSVLRTYVSRLRKVLRSGARAAESSQVVISVTDGYLARVPEHSLDLGVFEERVARARKLRAAGEVPAAAALLHGALDEWEGTALAGLPGPLAEAERSRLAEQRLCTLEACLEADVELGRHTEVIPALITLTGEQPLREQLCQLLMLALYRSGRQAEALAAYRRTRSTLVAELGIEPGAPLQELHDRILAADASLTPSAPTPEATEEEVSPQEPRTVGHATRPAQLPADLPAFTGRQDVLGQTLAADSGPDTMEQPSILAIGGMAGVGKTTLAVHWAHRIAHRYPDGQLYINLRGFDPTGAVVPPAEAIRTFLDALGVPAQDVPAPLEAQAALYRSVLVHRRMLIVLDNAHDTEQIRPLLPGSPGCAVIVTGRSQLTGLIANEGAQPLTLGPLTPAEAHDFLARRVGAARLAAEPRAADEIIACCGRLPLALAVVAARAATNPGFALGTIAGELRDGQGGLDALAGGDPTTDVRTAFSWSYEALSAPAARLFHLLGLHSGPDISAHAAAALAGLPLRETRGLLAEITRIHLLTEHSPGRYSLHDLLRAYAAERVATEEPPQERDRAVERLLRWYQHTADAAYPHLAPRRRRIPLEALPPGCRPLEFASRDQALEWCEAERPNLVAAVQQAAAARRSGIAWRLTSALWGFFYLRSHLHDWLNAARLSFDSAREAGDRTGEAWSRGDMALVLTMLRRFDEAIEHFREVAVLCEQLGDTRGRSHALGNLGNAYLQSGRLDEAAEYLHRSLALGRTDGYTWGEGITLAILGDVRQRQGRFDEAIDYLREGLRALHTTGNRWVEGVALDVLGTVQHRRRRHDAAIGHYHEALEAHRDLGNRWGEGDTLGHLGDVLLAAGEPEAARGRWAEALAIFEESGHPDAEAIRGRLRGLDARTPAPGRRHTTCVCG